MATQHASIKRLAAPFEAFVVDGFQFQKRYPDVRHWFLSHAHSDHTCGLTGGFDAGTIYCSSITKRALERDISPVLSEVCQTFEAGEVLTVQGCTVRALDACHCPGSLVFIFEMDGYRVLHTGDFRASEAMVSQFGASDIGFDRVYLDTTYASPRWSFPSQVDACSLIGDFVSQQLTREPLTLFMVGTYSLGKENAVDAAIRASGGVGWLPPRRAAAFKFCGRWDDALHTEDKLDQRGVRVWVESFGGASQAPARNLSRDGKQGPHDRLLAVLDNAGGSFSAVCSLRCTGWEYRGRAAYSEWVENEGKTRLVGVPYSEHSSWLELKAFVRRVRPKRIEPTVGGESSSSRQLLRDLFAAETDLSADLGKLDSFIDRGREDDSLLLLRRVDVSRQRALLAEATPALTVDRVDESLLRILSEVLVGSTRPYLERLLIDAGDDIDTALAIHFGPNQGKCNAELGVDDDEDDQDLLVGAVFEVFGADGDFKLFRGKRDTEKPERTSSARRKQSAGGAAERIRARLRELGATVVDAYAPSHKKLAPTHVVVPEGTDPQSLANLDKLVVVKPESWLLRKIKKLESGALERPTPEQLRAAQAKLNQPRPKIKDLSACGEKRKGRRRQPTAESRAVRDRAMSERFYLVARSDETPVHFSRLSPPPKHRFAIMGSTGNVYDVTIYFEPKCTCPFAVSHPAKVCKHRFFVFCKVLALPDDYEYVAYQRYLRSDELRAVLGRAENKATLASTAAQAAYSGTPVLSSSSDPAPRRPIKADMCCVCFESLVHVDQNTQLDWCRACGVNLHTKCLTLWLARDPTCPACRAAWTAKDDAHAATEEGFLNLRNLQPGVRKVRDTSTYALDANGTQWRIIHAERRLSLQSDSQLNSDGTEIAEHIRDQPAAKLRRTTGRSISRSPTTVASGFGMRNPESENEVHRMTGTHC